ncbi:hypothetical protein CRM22_011407, partial [Opisthorchis felineus]
MAEAHAAVALTFTVSSEGVAFDINKQAIEAVIKSGVVAGRKRLIRFKNSIYNQVYPFHPSSWFYFAFTVFAAIYLHPDYRQSPCGIPILYLEGILQRYLGITRHYHVPACLLFSLFLWFFGSLLNKAVLRILFSYTGWMYSNRKRTNWYDVLWMYLVTLFKSKHPRLYGYQYSLPNLPLPSLRDTIDRYLLSVRHLLPVAEYEERVRQAELFRKGPGRRLQFFLWMKTWFTSNYVTDWWEDYVYLASREPIMANSNFYGVQWKFTRTVQPTQSARAALLTYLFLKVREKITREELEPLLVNKLVPLCSWQYERPFNTTRIPCLEKDKLIHLSDSNHIAVYHRGRYYRCPVLVDGHHLSAAEFEYMFNRILYFDNSPPATGEEKLAAFTAGPRDAWAIARSTFFSSGINRTSLDAIERAAFFVALDDEERDLDSDVNEDLSYLGKTFLTGNCYNRWFDKSFALIVLPNGSCGFNAEHSWGDAPILSHLIEFICAEENAGIEQNAPGLHYTASGSCDGPVSKQIWPTRLRWDIPPECVQAMEASYNIARNLADSIDLYVMRFCDFGSGFMKKAGFSPDAFMQISLQLAYFM